MANSIKTINLLPEFLRTDKNSKFLSSTADQWIKKPELERIDGYVGSTSTPPRTLPEAPTTTTPSPGRSSQRTRSTAVPTPPTPSPSPRVRSSRTLASPTSRISTSSPSPVMTRSHSVAMPSRAVSRPSMVATVRP
jgi:hypothetical protein